MTLLSPKGDAVRPTTDFVKENLFNIIQSDVDGARFLDLFAGSGAIGIEALSRGAAHCTFVDAAQKSLDLLHKNLEKARLASDAIIVKGNIPEAIARLCGKKFDIIFLDPPYGKGLAEKCVDAIITADVLAEDGYVVIEIGARETFAPPHGAEIFKEKTYGSSKLIFLARSENP